MTNALYDAPSHAIIPFGQGQAEDPLGDMPRPAGAGAGWDPTAVWRVKLASRRDCGPLGLGGHACLIGEGVERAGN